MLHIGNLRTESSNGWTKLIADITQKGWGYDFLPEHTIWIAVKDEDAYMLADDVYDAFLLVPLYLGMLYKQNVHIHGCVSKTLYKNAMNYLQSILCNFSDNLSRIKLHVDGFKETDGNQNIIGAALSCGVDSLSTIYDRYILEEDPDYKINALLFLNTGWNGSYYDAKTMKICMNRYNANKRAADELGLPFHMIDSNFHAFRMKPINIGDIGYLSNYSCILGLGRAIKKYYVSSCFSYNQILTVGKEFKGTVIAQYSESYSLPLIRTERTELIIDGCQYTRSQKTERIADWDIAHKYLNPCTTMSEDFNGTYNCSICPKCMLTLLALDAIGKLDKFSGIFDLEKYREHADHVKAWIVMMRIKNIAISNEPDIYAFLKDHGMRFPSKFAAYMHFIRLKLKSALYNIRRGVYSCFI